MYRQGVEEETFTVSLLEELPEDVRKRYSAEIREPLDIKHFKKVVR